MRDIVQEVRRQYESFPYPGRQPGTVADVHPHLLLSYLAASRPTHPIWVLDAGCGTGTAALGTAMCNPDVRVVAADFNRVALDGLRSEARELGLTNLEVVETDLTSLEGLKVPEGGFDVIFSSGVIHHLPDPGAALRLLAGTLAADGVLRLMVYNRLGRQALYRFVEALNLIHPHRDRLEERLALGRRLLDGLRGGPVLEPPWEASREVEDVEFVDRYLHLHDLSFSVVELMELVEGAGLRFVRWHEPRDWRLESAADLDLELDLDPLTTARVVEQLANRPRLDAILGARQARSAELPALTQAHLALNPQVVLTSRRVKAGTGLLALQQTARLRQGPDQPLTPAEARALELAAGKPMAASELPVSLETIEQLLAQELLYVPR